MMAGILSSIDQSQHHISVFAHGDPSPDKLFKFTSDISIMSSYEPGDPWGAKKLLTVINTSRPDLVFFVGVDVWRYADVYAEMLAMAQTHGFKTMCLAPYDLPDLRQDWLTWYSVFDHVLIYSEYGHSMVSPHLNSCTYFRPPAPHLAEFGKSEVARAYGRKTSFPTLPQNGILVGFVGNNQFRKDPMGHVEAFALAVSKNPNLYFYFHTNLRGVFNLQQLCSDADIPKGHVFAKDQTIPVYPTNRLVQTYNALDMLVMCSAFEGLSYTPLEAMKCGVPVIVSDSTAHPELVGEAGLFVAPSIPYMVPVKTGYGEAFIRVKSCRPDAIAEAIDFAAKPGNAKRLSAAGITQADTWLAGTMDINEQIRTVLMPEAVSVSDQIDAVLFAQHSAAGDVLMTTQCFRGLRDKHPGKKLVYMTQRKFHDLLKGNPYLDEVIDWNPDMLRRYAVVYNPHGERIVTGGFNSLDTTLYEMYPYFCGKLEASKMYVPQTPVFREDIVFPQEYIIVQTAGGSKEYRTYAFMDEATWDINWPIIQIGSLDDPLCQNTDLDLRGKLSFSESAWVVARATAAVVIDSYPAHLCGALGVPAIVLYGPAPARVTHPRDDAGVIVNIEPNRLDACPVMTTCWGAYGKRPCATPCINTIDPQIVRAKLLEVLAKRNPA